VTIAALDDAHASLPALAAVLAEVLADATIVLGGRALWLRGNCDREQTEVGGGPASHDVLEWVGERLTPADAAFLHELPPTLELGPLLFCHPTPRSDVYRFDADTPEAEIAPWFAGVQTGTALCGHTHRQFDRRLGVVRVVNAGSVGMPHEDRPGAYWALLEGDGGRVELRRTAYDPSPLAATAGYQRPWWDA
jgi:predicted phosphodiesterase